MRHWRRCAPSRASGRASGSPASAARPPTSCCCGVWSSIAGAGWTRTSSRTPTPPAASSPAPRRLSSRSSAPTASAARSARSSAVSASSSPRSCSSSPSRCVFFGHAPPLWMRGAGAGAGAAVAAVAVEPRARCSCRATSACAATARAWLRWAAYLVAAGRRPRRCIGPYLVLVLLGCGLSSSRCSAGRASLRACTAGPLAALAPRAVAAGGLGSAVLDGVQGRRALLRRRLRDHPADAGRRRAHLPLDDRCRIPERRRARPGHPRAPWSPTVAAVGYAAHGLGGGLLAASVAFTPSFSFILLGGGASGACARAPRARAFLAGAGPAAIGAILGAAVPLTGALRRTVAVRACSPPPRSRC